MTALLADELPGRWVVRGGVRHLVPIDGESRWVVDDEPDLPEHERPDPNRVVVRRPHYGRLAGLRMLCDCGCLIVLHETCPNCTARERAANQMFAVLAGICTTTEGNHHR